ncbi:hypothetical protein V8Z80_04865 [Orrella sp. JC864]|uniref:hypothetical protein n=1 Tax=Orrella sp. JC864 TaxID=3120298 RepID=UPI00300ADCC2
MADVLELTKEVEHDFLQRHAQQAGRAMAMARADGLSPAGLAQLEDVIQTLRDESIGRIRTSTLLFVLDQGAKREGN